MLNGSRMLKKVTKQLSSQVELVHFGNLSAIMLCLGWGGGVGVNCPSDTRCALQYWLEKLVGEIHVDPIAARMQDAGQQLNWGLAGGGLTC